MQGVFEVMGNVVRARDSSNHASKEAGLVDPVGGGGKETTLRVPSADPQSVRDQLGAEVAKRREGTERRTITTVWSEPVGAKSFRQSENNGNIKVLAKE